MTVVDHGIEYHVEYDTYMMLFLLTSKNINVK
jgi:hypothetical protein